MRKLKIMLINPPVLSVLEPWFDSPKFVRTSLAFLAGYLREHQKGEFEISCFDAKFERKNFSDAADEIIKWQPDIIGFTAFTNEIKPAAYLAGLIKQRLTKAITIIGGAHITAIPEQTLKEFPVFDIGVIGEGEETLLELCLSLKEGNSLNGIKGIIFRKNAELLINPVRPRLLNQDSLPMPAWDMLPIAEEYYIQSERGCPFNCVFCLNHNGKVARKRSVENTIREMEWLIQYAHPKRISFGDELFSIDMKRTSELLDQMILHNIGKRVSWDIQTHVGYVNDELFKKMKTANISRCEMGVEAGDEATLKRMGKATTRTMIKKAFRSAHKNGIVTGSFLLLGQPYETHRSIWNTIQIGIEINPTEPIIGTMVPYPGTEVANMAAKGEAGYKLISTNWDEYRKQLNGSLEFSNISRTALEWYQILGYTIIFLANGRLLDFLKFFWNYRGGAIKLFSKAFMRRQTTKGMMNIPEDYERVIASSGNISMSEMVASRSYWEKYQRDEIKRTKELMPQLLKEQMPL